MDANATPRAKRFGPPPRTIEQFVARCEAIGATDLAEAAVEAYTDPQSGVYGTVRALDELLSMAELSYALEEAFPS